MSEQRTVHVEIELPTWVYRILQTAAERNRVHPAVYISHLLKLTAFLTEGDLKRARNRAIRFGRIRELWKMHHSHTSIASILGIDRSTVTQAVRQLDKNDRRAA